MRLALLALLAGCPSATVGTIDLGLATAPGSTLLSEVSLLRVTLSSPRQTVEATRGPNGFSITLDVEASGAPGFLIVEGFDVNGGLIAVGSSPEFGVAAIDARIVVYVAKPFSVDRAPVSLMPPRDNAAIARLTYGAIFAGGRDPTSNAPSDAIAVYNAFDHSLAGGLPMPAPRDGIILAQGPNDIVSLFGGRDASANPTGTYWLFDTNFAPSGAYLEVGDHPGFARADELAFPIAADRFVVTGTPPIEMQGSTVAARGGLTALAPTAATFVDSRGARTGIAIDPSGNVVRFRNDTFDSLAITRADATVAALPDGRFIVVGGGGVEDENDIVVVDANTGTTTVVADALAEPRRTAPVAVTTRHVVVLGGGATEILDAVTLARIATAASTNGKAVALPNGQVLIVEAGGALALFTPLPPGV